MHQRQSVQGHMICLWVWSTIITSAPEHVHVDTIILIIIINISSAHSLPTIYIVDKERYQIHSWKLQCKCTYMTVCTNKV